MVVGGMPNLTRYGCRVRDHGQADVGGTGGAGGFAEAAWRGNGADQVTVRIGQENPYKELQSTSVVASGYGSQVDTFATLGVIGPTRMDYPSTMASVRAVARYVGRFLSEG